MHHGHGLSMGLMVPLMVGSSVVFLSDFTVDAFYRCLDVHAPSWYSASPAFHQAILSQARAYPDIVGRNQLRVIISSSGGLPAGDLVTLENTFETTVLELFDLTEAGTLAARPLSPKARKPGTLGKIIPEAVAIMDAEDAFLPPGEVGEIVTRGPSVFAGYLNNRAASEAAFVGDWFRTGDLASLDADGFLTLHGRVREIINRGGEKIAPREIEDVLLAHPGVREAVAFPIPHPSLGEIVGAAIVPAIDVPLTVQEVKRFALERLAGHKAPVTVIKLDTIPTGPLGKVPRNKLATLLGIG
jgi:acyl-CoA synthetase (AMP-forming)/AMP-acid ligase II